MQKQNRSGTKFTDGRPRSVFEIPLRLLYPPRCPICDILLPVNGGFICPDCVKKLPRVTESVGRKCAKLHDSDQSKYCEDCRGQGHLFDRGWAAFTCTGD